MATDTAVVGRILLNAVADLTPIHPVPAMPGNPATLSVPVDADAARVVAVVLGGYGIARPTTTAADLYSEMPALAAVDATAVKTRCHAAIEAAMAPRVGPQPLDCYNIVGVMVVGETRQSATEGLALVGQALAPALRSALPIRVRSDAWAPDASLRGKEMIPPLDADLVILVGDVPGRVLDALPTKAIRVSTRDHPVKPVDAVNLVRDVLKAGYGLDHPTTTRADLEGPTDPGYEWTPRLSGADRDALRTGCGLDGA